MAEENELAVYISQTENEIVKIEADVQDGDCVLAIYDDYDILKDVTSMIMKDGVGQTNVKCPAGDYIVRLYYDIGKDVVLSATSDEVKVLKNDETPEDENPKPDKNEGAVGNLPEAAKLGSLAVVKNVGEEFDDEKNEIVAYIDALYCGEEIRIELEPGFLITDAEAPFSQMKGKSIAELKEGDVLSLTANLAGRLNGIKLMFRAPAVDLVSSSENAPLFDTTDDGKMFGIVTDKLNNKTIVISDISGMESKNAYVDLEADTSVYMYDFKKRSDKVRIAVPAEITKSFIPYTDVDEDDNIVNWSDGFIHNYIYVRSYRGVVCDVVIYANYMTEKQ